MCLCKFESVGTIVNMYSLGGGFFIKQSNSLTISSPISISIYTSPIQLHPSHNNSLTCSFRSLSRVPFAVVDHSQSTSKKMEQETMTLQMNGGDGVYSYSKNSDYQRKTLEGAKGLVSKGIAEKFDLKHICSSSPTATFCIADLGCSVGPNTFIAMQNIIDGIQQKYKSEGLSSQDLEFQVFFNDHVSNDFNKLFASLPPKRQYFAAAIPGSFSKRLFPKESLHFVHSSTAIQWLSRVPKDVEDVNSSTFNKGLIHFGNAPKLIQESFLAQFVKDMDTFFSARAEEVVSGGLMALILPSRPKQPKRSTHFLDILESCIVEMTKEGLLSEAKVDSFNLPMYIPAPEEFEETIKSNGCFTIERFELLYLAPEAGSGFDGQKLSMQVRAAFEGVVSEHLGTENMDELFARFSAKAAETFKSDVRFDADLLVLLKRK